MHLWAERLDALAAADSARPTRPTTRPTSDRPPAGPARHCERTHHDAPGTSRAHPPGPSRQPGRPAATGRRRRRPDRGAVPRGDARRAGRGRQRPAARRPRGGPRATRDRRDAAVERAGPTTTPCWSRRPRSWRRTSRASGPTSTCPWRRPARRSSRRSGRRCGRSPTARPRRTARSRGASAGPVTAPGRSAWPTAATRSRSIVPCHRVVGASGAMTGYGGGMDRKRILLELEGALAPRNSLSSAMRVHSPTFRVLPQIGPPGGVTRRRGAASPRAGRRRPARRGRACVRAGA